MSWCVSSREEPGIAPMDSHKHLLSSHPVREESDSRLIPHSAWILLFWFLLFFLAGTIHCSTSVLKLPPSTLGVTPSLYSWRSRFACLSFGFYYLKLNFYKILNILKYPLKNTHFSHGPGRELCGQMWPSLNQQWLLGTRMCPNQMALVMHVSIISVL